MPSAPSYHCRMGGGVWLLLNSYALIPENKKKAKKLKQKSKIPITKQNNLKSATKPLNVLIAFTRPLITEFADKLNLKHPLLPTISPYPTM